MSLKKLSNITPAELKSKGVVSLADKPNAAASYGVGGLSPTALKLWFDQLSKLLADKINAIQDALSGDNAAEYIKLILTGLDSTNETGEYSLKDLCDAFRNGNFAEYLQAFGSANANQLKSLQSILNSFAEEISLIKENIGSGEGGGGTGGGTGEGGDTILPVSLLTLTGESGVLSSTDLTAIKSSPQSFKIKIGSAILDYIDTNTSGYVFGVIFPSETQIEWKKVTVNSSSGSWNKYDLTFKYNHLNIPIPTAQDNGKVLGVQNGNFKFLTEETGDDGTENKEVIVQYDTLPTATADSPDFVQTPDGTLYRKSKRESAAGAYTWNNTPTSPTAAINASIDFTYQGAAQTSMNIGSTGGIVSIAYYPAAFLYTSATGWGSLSKDFTIQSDEIPADLAEYLSANATRQGAATILYSYEVVGGADITFATNEEIDALFTETQAPTVETSPNSAGGTTYNITL